MKKIVFVFLAALVSLISTAQQVKELNEVLSIMKASGDPSVRAEGLHLESLVYDLHPTLFYENGQITGTPEGLPVRVNSDVASMGMVTTAGNYQQVEILVIRIQSDNDLMFRINLSELSGYSNLKYIFFLSSFEICQDQVSRQDCEIEKISRMVNRNGNNRVLVTYSVSIPS